VASVEERVIDIVCESLAVDKGQITRSTSFQEDVGADSLDVVELVMELEEEFEIQFQMSKQPRFVRLARQLSTSKESKAKNDS